MICKRCQRSLRGSEGLQCSTCESKFHMRCVSEYCPERRDGGDRGYQWKCALCQRYASNGDPAETGKDTVTLLHTINSIREKFELVNKIQLPKLNSDLMQIKAIADRIAQQNDDILRRINEIEDKRKYDKPHSSPPCYRKRNVCFSSLSTTATLKCHEMPTSFTEKTLRYRMRRRSYLWHRISNLLNRRVHRSKSPRNLK